MCCEMEFWISFNLLSGSIWASLAGFWPLWWGRYSGIWGTVTGTTTLKIIGKDE